MIVPWPIRVEISRPGAMLRRLKHSPVVWSWFYNGLRLAMGVVLLPLVGVVLAPCTSTMPLLLCSVKPPLKVLFALKVSVPEPFAVKAAAPETTLLNVSVAPLSTVMVESAASVTSPVSVVALAPPLRNAPLPSPVPLRVNGSAKFTPPVI